MSRIEGRLKRLEGVLGKPGECHCGRDGKPSAAIYYPDEGQDRPSESCPSCGGKRKVIAIVYEPAWRSSSHSVEAPFE